MIIGLSGFARAGKDEVAKHLVENHGFIRVSFADTLRDFLYALNPRVMVQIDEDAWDRERFLDPPKMQVITVQNVIDEFGWDGYKSTLYGAEIRRLLQRLGTEAGRQTLWDTIWIDAALKDLHPNKKYVVSDARFLNEFDAITDKGGFIVRVNRPGVDKANDHASETEALQYNFTHIIDNDGTLDDLATKVDETLAQLKG